MSLRHLEVCMVKVLLHRGPVCVREEVRGVRMMMVFRVLLRPLLPCYRHLQVIPGCILDIDILGLPGVRLEVEDILKGHLSCRRNLHAHHSCILLREVLMGLAG